MTDRIKGLSVALEKPIRADDCEELIAAIKMLKGVAKVKTHVANYDHWFAAQQVRNEIKDKILDVVASIVNNEQGSK
jgi:ADP-dependent phosphofructokinase/glucokinase